MGMLNLTIQVRGIPAKASQAEVETLFSYCGNVEKINLQRNEDSSQSALVTFRQPFAYRTALLLNDVPVAGEPIRVLPSDDSAADHPISRHYFSHDTEGNREKEPGQVRASSASKAAKIITVIIPYTPVVALVLLLSKALYHLAKHALNEERIR